MMIVLHRTRALPQIRFSLQPLVGLVTSAMRFDLWKFGMEVKQLRS